MKPKVSPIKLVIVERQLVQAEVARDAQMSESRLNRILNGWIDARDYELKNIAHALGIRRDQLPV